jgi:hypothetical protein
MDVLSGPQERSPFFLGRDGLHQINRLIPEKIYRGNRERVD